MYINYLSDPKNLGFSSIKDIEAGEKLFAATNKVFVITIVGMQIYFISPDTFKNLEMLKTQNPEVVKIINISGEAADCPQKIIGPNLYVSILDEYRPSGLYMSNFQRSSLVHQHYSSYHSQEVINELRAGDSRLTQAA